MVEKSSFEQQIDTRTAQQSHDDEISDENKFELFAEYLTTDEWTQPVKSFIDYYCIIFTNEDQEENAAEKQKVYNQYKAMVNQNLESFLRDLLGINKEQLGKLMSQYADKLQVEDMLYFLAVEDFDTFHEFMVEACQQLNRQAVKNLQREAHDKKRKEQQHQQSHQQQRQQKTEGKLTEEEIMALAIAQSQQATQNEKLKAELEQQREEEEMRRAMEESMKNLTEEEKQKMQEDEELRLAIERSELEEKERQANAAMSNKADRKAGMNAKRAELKKRQEQLQSELHQQVKDERQRLIIEEQQARRKVMLEKLRQQKEENLINEMNQELSGNKQAKPLDKDQANQNSLQVPTQENIEERRLRLQAQRDMLQKKKLQDAEKEKEPAQKRDQGDVFRNTQMKFNESKAEKDARLNRCLKVLRDVPAQKSNLVDKFSPDQAVIVESGDNQESDVIEDKAEVVKQDSKPKQMFA